MGKTATAHARLSPEIKEEAEAILKNLGISISAAYEMFYRQIIVNNGLPFEARIPSESTRTAMQDARDGIGQSYGTVDDMFEDLNSK